MERRTFNKMAGLTAMGVLAKLDLHAQQAAASKEVVLEDSELLVAFDKASGALTRMERKSTSWPIQRRPALGVSFRMLAPMPDRRDNFILGQKQRAASVEKISENQVRLVWKDLASENGGVLAITFTATVTLTSGALTFECNLQNDSPLSNRDDRLPILRRFESPTKDTSMQAGHMWVGSLQEQERSILISQMERAIGASRFSDQSDRFEPKPVLPHSSARPGHLCRNARSQPLPTFLPSPSNNTPESSKLIMFRSRTKSRACRYTSNSGHVILSSFILTPPRNLFRY